MSIPIKGYGIRIAAGSIPLVASQTNLWNTQNLGLMKEQALLADAVVLVLITSKR